MGGFPLTPNDLHLVFLVISESLRQFMNDLRESWSIRLEKIKKVFDSHVVAVDDVSLDIREGEFFSLLGPSGCGKTTTLRLIAGFEEPTEGTVYIRGRDVTRIPPHKRDTGMVFQNYALFPHRSIFDNVAFGLRMRRLPKEAIKKKVNDALKLVEMEGLGDRRPSQLSGGQQQRVALARAIVIEPTVLLCDEPLGALDKKLRQQMQFELKKLQKKIGVTLVYVTHDQEEALTMSDRIAVMHRGRVIQMGFPLQIYNHPQTKFVSNFIGDSNLFEGSVEKMDNGLAHVVTTDPIRLVTRGNDVAPGDRLTIAVRPEKARLLITGETAGNSYSGSVESANFMGVSILYRIALPSGRLVFVIEPNDGNKPIFAPGQEVRVGWEAADCLILKG
jgi:putative spermidine/putrescine transport system ATP-binding protein